MIAGPVVRYPALAKLLSQANDTDELVEIAVRIPYEDHLVEMATLFLGFICLYLVDEKSQEVYLTAVSDTEHYRLAVRDYPFNPKKFRLPLDETKNDIVKTIVENKIIHNDDWSHLSRRHAAVETVRLNQASSGIATTFMYPLTGNQRGALMFNYFQYSESIGKPQLDFMQRYTELVSEALDSV